MRDSKYQHHCEILWADWADNLYYFNMVGAQAIELFGLPGDRYITDLGDKSIKWSFKSAQDSTLFRLKFGEVVV